MKEYNSDSERKEVHSPVPLSPKAFDQEIKKGAVVVDLRSQNLFCAGYIPDSICIGFGEKFGYWDSLTLPYDRPILLMPPDLLLIDEAILALARVGLFLSRVISKEGAELGVKMDFLLRKPKRSFLNPLEMRRSLMLGLIKNGKAINWKVRSIFLAQNSNHDWMSFPMKSSPLFVRGGGYRSVLVASLAEHHGHKNASHLSGGLLACRNHRLTLG